MSEQKPFVPKTPLDFQKLKLERLMANPTKPVVILEMPKDRKGLSVPEFVRNVMGSSAGAGSGEFHVYRHLRRKEYTRQKIIEERAEKERLDEEFQKKLEENRRKMDEKTAKNRAKRLKRKRNKKLVKNPKKTKLESREGNGSESDSESCESSSRSSDSDPDSNAVELESKDSSKSEKGEDIKGVIS